MVHSPERKKAPEIQNEAMLCSYGETMAGQMPGVGTMAQSRDEKTGSVRGNYGLGSRRNHRASEHG